MNMRIQFDINKKLLNKSSFNNEIVRTHIHIRANHTSMAYSLPYVCAYVYANHWLRQRSSHMRANHTGMVFHACVSSYGP